MVNYRVFYSFVDISKHKLLETILQFVAGHDYNNYSNVPLYRSTILPSINVPIRDPNPWMTEKILSAKRKRRINERIRRKSKLPVHQEIDRNLCLLVKKQIRCSK